MSNNLALLSRTENVNGAILELAHGMNARTSHTCISYLKRYYPKVRTHGPPPPQIVQAVTWARAQCTLPLILRLADPLRASRSP